MSVMSVMSVRNVMNARVRSWGRSALLALALGAACGTAPRPETRSAARIPDSAPEKAAAQRAATPGLGLEADEQRWGVEAARERRGQADAKASVAGDAVSPAPARGSAPAPAPGVAPGPVDLQKQK
jgi:hypothetical protein